MKLACLGYDKRARNST